MGLNGNYPDQYDDAEWGVAAGPEETLIIHLLGVLPEYHGRGYGRRMVEYAVRLAEENAKKTIRLDTLADNRAAVEFYPSVGFDFICEMMMYYEDTGWTLCRLYEYNI